MVMFVEMKNRGDKPAQGRFSKVALSISFTCAIAGACGFVVPVQAGHLTANAQNEAAATASSGPAAVDNAIPTGDGVAFIDKCLKAANAYTDYSFDYTQTVYKDSGTVVEKGTVLVKKPQLKAIVRTGPKAGSVALVLPDGQVKAHGGGAFKFITVTLPATSDYLRSANGWPMVKSDFGSIWKAMQEYASKDKCPAKVTTEPVTEPTQKNKVLVLVMTKPDGAKYKRALVDPATNIPVEWWDYQNGKLYAHSLWTNFKGNQGLTDKEFSTTKIEKGEK
jgi:outer membrane lipoprotein-sorting protein